MNEIYDVVVIGGGPAGLTAALYLARARLSVMVLEREQFGGQIAITDEVVNYPGIESISGSALAETMRKQAQSFGAEFSMDEAVSLELDGDVKTVRCRDSEYRCLGVMIATGAKPRSAGFKGEEEYRGHGVAYCATCDGEFFTDRDVYVIGGGYAAAEEAIFLTKFARHVTVMIRGEDFSCAASIAAKVRDNEKISVLTNTVMEEVRGENGLNYARYSNRASGEQKEIVCPDGESFGVFVFAGYKPSSELFKGLVDINEQGYIVTTPEGKTSIDRVYAAGDVCAKSLRQAVTAAGDAAVAATALEKSIAALEHKSGSFGAKKKENKGKSGQKTAEGGFLGVELTGQLETVFSKFKHGLTLRVWPDEREVSKELVDFMKELAALTDKLSVSIEKAENDEKNRPYVEICDPDGKSSGMAFHGVPGGHEFGSFIIALCNAGGAGRSLSEDVRHRIEAIGSKTDIKILVTLSCSMCPDTVAAAQRIAAENPLVTAHAYDIRFFEELRQRYKVMSVPCVIINDAQPSFGKKNVEQLLDLLESK